jgi:Domain of Unknown Function with PDB structure (DUF3857)
MRTVLYIIGLQLAALTGFAQDKPEYNAAFIPDSLRKNANSVYRLYDKTMEISRPGKATMRIREVITVLNEADKRSLNFVDYTDKFRKLDDVDITLYDGQGKRLKKYKRKDMKEELLSDDGTFLQEARLLYTIVSGITYPITVEQEYTIQLNGILDIDDFYAQYYEQSIQHGKLTIKTTADNKVRYKNYRCQLQPDIKTEGNNIIYTWEVNNAKALEYEAGGPSLRETAPRVIIAPTLFEMDGYGGDMSSWQSFGRWYYELSNRASDIPESSKQTLTAIAAKGATSREKIRLLYEYLQKNNRYVSIQLGIGGWQPFPASYVDKKKYGDCKALSNYMQAMLGAIGIRSYQALINAGYNSPAVDRDFSCNKFNHVILCVPMNKDTIWLECTSNNAAFGVLGNFTENKNALLITDNGGVLAATPRSNAKDNILSAVTTVALKEDGSGNAAIQLQYSGEVMDMMDYVLRADASDQVNWWVNSIGGKQPDHFTLASKAKNGSTATAEIGLAIEQVPDFGSGSKYFLAPRLYKIWNRKLSSVINRKTDFYFEYPTIKTDTTIYVLPAGYSAETLPKPARLQFAHGSYESEYRYDAGKNAITCSARLVLNEMKISPAHYPETKTFFDAMQKEESQKIVIKKD